MKIGNVKQVDKITVPLPNEIPGNLRATRITSNLLKDRFTSIQERSLVDYPKGEMKGKAKNKNKPRFKFTVKRSHKDPGNL